MPQPQKKRSTSQTVMTVVGIVLCVLLVPILIINLTLIIKSYTNSEEVPTIGGYAPLIVLTGSMEPGIKEGDLIFVKQIDGSKVEEGDVIAFFDPDGNGTSVVTHRVKEINEENGVLYFTTWGDANGGAVDPKPVSEEKLVGIYTDFRIPGAGNVAMFMQTTAGLIICVFLPLVLLVGWDIYRRRRHEHSQKQDTDALMAELEALKAEKAAAEAAGAAAEMAAELAEAAEPAPEEPADAGDGTDL